MNLLSRFSCWRLGKNSGLNVFVKKYLREGGCARDYHFIFHCKDMVWCLNNMGDIFCDGEYTIILARKICKAFWPFCSDQIACIGFDISVHGVITVVQIQGVRNKQDELKALRWDRMLLEMLVTLARESGFEEIRVQASHLNRWPRGRNHLRYDVLPQRMGFTTGENYHTLRLRT